MVGLHVTSDVNGLPFADATAIERVAPMLVRAVLYTARTELFIIISIFLLLEALDRRPRSYGVVIGQQVRRLLVPFLFWTLFYAAYSLIKAGAFGYLDQDLARLRKPVAWVGFLLLGNVKYHMHFIPTLFGLLLFFPMFRVAERLPQVGLLVLALLLARRELDGYIYVTFWNSEALPYVVRLVKIVTYTGYGFAAAALLGAWRLGTRKIGDQWVGLLVLLAGVLFVFKLIATGQVIQTGQWVFDYDPAYWADYLMPVMVFAICMCLGHRRWPTAISRMSKFAFGIYLCHPIFLDVAEIVLNDQKLTPISFVLAKFLWTFPMTCVFVFCLSKTSIAAWTIGLGQLPLPDRRRAPLDQL